VGGRARSHSPIPVANRSSLVVTVLLACVGLGVTCPSPTTEITSARAVEIARAQVTFEPASIDVDKTSDGGQPTWRVTFRGNPASPDHPQLRPITIVLIDRRTGEVRSVAKG